MTTAEINDVERKATERNEELRELSKNYWNAIASYDRQHDGRSERFDTWKTIYPKHEDPNATSEQLAAISRPIHMQDARNINTDIKAAEEALAEFECATWGQYPNSRSMVTTIRHRILSMKGSIDLMKGLSSG